MRVHKGSQAAESAQAINACAYTTGRDVVFGAGEYAPETVVGRQLLAHELTHVVQQTGEASGVVSPRLQRAGVSDQPPTQEPLPQEFDVESEEPHGGEELAPESGSVPPGSPSFEVLTDFVSKSAYRTKDAFNRALTRWARKYA